MSRLAPVNVCIHPRERWQGEHQSWLFHFVGKESKARGWEASTSAQREAMTDASYSVGSVFKV